MRRYRKFQEHKEDASDRQIMPGGGHPDVKEVQRVGTI